MNPIGSYVIRETLSSGTVDIHTGIDTLTGMPVLLYLSLYPFPERKIHSFHLLPELARFQHHERHVMVQGLPLGFQKLPQHLTQELALKVWQVGQNVLTELHSKGLYLESFSDVNIFLSGDGVLFSLSHWLKTPCPDTELLRNLLLERTPQPPAELQPQAPESEATTEPIEQVEHVAKITPEPDPSPPANEVIPQPETQKTTTPLKKAVSKPYVSQPKIAIPSEVLPETLPKAEQAQPPHPDILLTATVVPPAVPVDERSKMTIEIPELKLKRVVRIGFDSDESWRTVRPLEEDGTIPVHTPKRLWWVLAVVTVVFVVWGVWLLFKPAPSTSEASCCEVEFKVTNAPVSAKGTVSIVSANPESALPKGYVVGDIPGTLTFPSTPAQYILKVDFENYSAETVVLRIPQESIKVFDIP